MLRHWVAPNSRKKKARLHSQSLFFFIFIVYILFILFSFSKWKHEFAESLVYHISTRFPLPFYNRHRFLFFFFFSRAREHRRSLIAKVRSGPCFAPKLFRLFFSESSLIYTIVYYVYLEILILYSVYYFCLSFCGRLPSSRILILSKFEKWKNEIF